MVRWKERLGRTSRIRECTLRRLLIVGASSAAGWASRKGVAPGSWLARTMARKPSMLVRVALARDGPNGLRAARHGGDLPSSGRGGTAIPHFLRSPTPLSCLLPSLSLRTSRCCVARISRSAALLFHRQAQNFSGPQKDGAQMPITANRAPAVDHAVETTLRR